MFRRAFFSAVLGLVSLAAFAQDSNPFTTGPTKSAAPAATTLTPEGRESVLKELKNILETRAFVPGIDFKKVGLELDKNKEELDKTNDPVAFARVINESLRSMGLSHLRLQTPRQAAARGQTSAVGIGVSVLKTDEGVRVTRVTPESPAAMNGIAVGDVITNVDGKAPERQEELEGEVGKKLKLTVKNAKGESKDLEVTIGRFSVLRKDVLTWPTPETAVLKIHTFSTGYDRIAIEGMMKDAAKAKNLVLDLRSNGGGAVNNLNHLLSLFLPDGTAYGAFVSKRVADDYTKANPNGPLTPEAIAQWAPSKASTRVNREVAPYTGKVAVLINRGSASASEITASALRENIGAKLIGGPTAGAVLASVFTRLPEGFSIQIPVSDYVSVKGMRLEKNPLKPDVEATGAPADGKDPVIEAAITALTASK